MSRARTFAVLVVAGSLATGGCARLLPRAQTDLQGGFAGFDAARDTIAAIKPYETHASALLAAGIDPYKNPTVTLLSYADLLQKLSAGGALRADEMDRGIRDCLLAGKRCTGYSIVQKRVDRDRVGNFWLDTFNFYRDVRVTGWSFNALVIMVDDLVVYTLYGGQPVIREREVTRNPLGPFQGWGEPAVRELLR